MWYLTAAVILVGALCVLDLILSLGIVRRLREQDETLARLTGPRPASQATVPVGRRIGEFTATTFSGAVVSRDGMVGYQLVGFLSPGCRPCEQQLPRFLEYAERFPGHVLAVVVADVADADEYTARLAPVADVVVEKDGGTVVRAFAVTGFPAFCLLGADGVVTANGPTMAALPALSRT